MASRFGGVTVGTDEVPIFLGPYRRILLTNEGSDTVFVTNVAGEAAASGFPVRQHETVEDTGGNGLYGATASGESDVRYAVE